MKTLAFTLTPALAVVLYVMAGVNTTTVYPGRDHAREVAALYTVRQSMVQWMERYVVVGIKVCQNWIVKKSWTSPSRENPSGSTPLPSKYNDEFVPLVDW